MGGQEEPPEGIGDLEHAGRGETLAGREQRGLGGGEPVGGQKCHSWVQGAGEAVVGRPWRATNRQPGGVQGEPRKPSLRPPSVKRALQPLLEGSRETPLMPDCTCVTWHSLHGHPPPPTGSGHLLAHRPAPNISHQRKINREAFPHLGPCTLLCLIHHLPAACVSARQESLQREAE